MIMLKELRKKLYKKRLVFVSGNFNILHPGHQRLLKFASECGDFLCVGVNGDRTRGVHVPQELRLESIKANSWVDEAFIIESNLTDVILDLKPDVIVKGKEHENHENLESELVASHGGKLLFSSGEAKFTSLDLIRNEYFNINLNTIKLPGPFLKRHALNKALLIQALELIKGLPALVIGDVILDEYITCDPLGMSQEDPTLVVSPLSTQKFLGGAGIVAAHACGLGANVTFLSVIGNDNTAIIVKELLEKYKVKNVLLKDDSRPTTLKQRFRADSKTLLRVNHLKQHDISKELQSQIYSQIETQIDNIKLLIFSDFNYGCLPQKLVDKITELCLSKGVLMVADSQSSSQIGDVSRFRNMFLLTPTEREARLSIQDSGSGLVVLTETLRKKAEATNVLLTLGREGLLVHAGLEEGMEDSWQTDRLPAMNSNPKDTAGAGDSLLTCCSLAMAAGADIWTGAYLGSVAAACQVARTGNIPLSFEEISKEILDC